MASKPRFSKAVQNLRPFKSHRYDVFAPKIRRMLTLYGRDSLNVWTLLEANPEVDCYCERPIVIADAKPKRIVDFWVKRKESEELWFLSHSDGKELPNKNDGLPPAFKTWATSQGFLIKFIILSSLLDRKVHIENWERILRYLSANERFVSAALIKQVGKTVEGPKTLQGIESHFPEEDPILIRTAAFLLLHRGMFRCDDLNESLLGPHSVFEAS